jgi:hypothetical protein
MIFCKKKIFQEVFKSIRWPLQIELRLIESGFATVVCVRISRQLCVPFCLKRGGFFEGAELLGRIWSQTLDQGWPAKVSGMGEGEGVRKRRVFEWSKQARDLAREYKQRMIAGQYMGQADRSVLVAMLVT